MEIEIPNEYLLFFFKLIYFLLIVTIGDTLGIYLSLYYKNTNTFIINSIDIKFKKYMY